MNTGTDYRFTVTPPQPWALLKSWFSPVHFSLMMIHCLAWLWLNRCALLVDLPGFRRHRAFIDWSHNSSLPALLKQLPQHHHNTRSKKQCPLWPWTFPTVFLISKFLLSSYLSPSCQAIFNTWLLWCGPPVQYPIRRRIPHLLPMMLVLLAAAVSTMSCALEAAKATTMLAMFASARYSEKRRNRTVKPRINSTNRWLSLKLWTQSTTRLRQDGLSRRTKVNGLK